MNNLQNLKFKGRYECFHIIGIGGIGMSGIAEILFNLGYQVQGSDSAESYNTERLRNLGVKVFIGHNPQNITNADYVVISTSISTDNVEYKEAQENHIPIIKRSEMLAEIMRFKICISVTGSHGKTSTTSMVASLFESAGLEPTVINGGIINTKSTNAYVGKGDYMVVEADESDATFIRIPSTIGIITNIDAEHLDYYKDFETLYKSFKKFVTNLPFYGFAVCCADHPITKQLSEEITERKIITYGIDSSDVNVRAINIKSDISGSTFDVVINLPKNMINYVIEGLKLSIPGKHNILNSLSAIAVAAELDFGIKAIKAGLFNFKGVKRRFTKTGEVNNVSFIDDYAHHPEEIKVTIATAKTVTSENNRVITILQPHRYSRLASLFNEFIISLKNADVIYVSPVYSAGEEKIEDYDNNKLVIELKKAYPDKKIEAINGEENIEGIFSTALPGDMLLFLGAGNISNWANGLSAKLLKNNL